MGDWPTVLLRQQVNQSRQAWGRERIYRGFPVMMYAIPLKVCSELRPAPGSRVTTTPAHTQGAGVPVSGAPVKGKTDSREGLYIRSVYANYFDCGGYKDA